MILVLSKSIDSVDHPEKVEIHVARDNLHFEVVFLPTTKREAVTFQLRSKVRS